MTVEDYEKIHQAGQDGFVIDHLFDMEKRRFSKLERLAL